MFFRVSYVYIDQWQNWKPRPVGYRQWEKWILWVPSLGPAVAAILLGLSSRPLREHGETCMRALHWQAPES